MPIPAYIGKAYNSPVERVTVPGGHGFAPLDCIRWTGSAWVKAFAQSENTIAQAIVIAVISPTQFDYGYQGRYRVAGHGLRVGETYYLSSSVPGLLVDDQPTFGPALVYVESTEALEILADNKIAEVDNLPLATAIAETDNFFLVQNGIGRKVEAGKVKPSPFQLARGLAGNVLEGYSDFSKTFGGYSGTNETLWGLEPYVCYVANTAVIQQGAPFLLFYTSALQSTVAANGHAFLQAAIPPIIFFGSGVGEYDQTWVVYPGTLATGPQAFTSRIGFIAYSAFPGTVINGMYFEYNQANNTFFACVTAGGSSVKRTTGVVVATATQYALRIFYDKFAQATKFYINGVLVETILDSEKVLTPNTLISMYAGLQKTAGATAAIQHLLHHKYKVSMPPIANF